MASGYVSICFEEESTEAAQLLVNKIMSGIEPILCPDVGDDEEHVCAQQWAMGGHTHDTEETWMECSTCS